MRTALFVASLACLPLVSGAQEVQLAVLQYKGGGDWYSNPTSVPNLVAFCNAELNTSFDEDVPYVEVGSPALFNYPFVHMTGHGNVVFTPSEARIATPPNLTDRKFNTVKVRNSGCVFRQRLIITTRITIRIQTL